MQKERKLILVKIGVILINAFLNYTKYKNHQTVLPENNLRTKPPPSGRHPPLRFNQNMQYWHILTL